jgi:DNA processing protein
MGQNSKPTPHPTPLDNDPSDCLRLIRSRRVGAVTWHRLMAEHGSAGAALQALPGVARAAGIEDYSLCPIEVVRYELSQGRAAGARLLVFGGPGYPAALNDLADAPPVLWAQGDVALLSQPMIAIVGARNASSLGVRMARRLAEGLGQAGFVTVSGLARGIDAEAHQASLATGTVAVQAGGVDVIYPEENAALAAEIVARGCRISEQPMGAQPLARHFPMRNRIVSGLSRAVVVVEAAARSGSLITARNALDQGREVLAVPGHPFDARASGCNMLLRDGATLVRGPQDVLEAIGAQVVAFPTPQAEADPEVPAHSPLPGPVPARRPLGDVAALHSRILARLGPSPLAEDQLIRDLAMPSATVVSQLLTLELDGRIHRAPGGLLSRPD